VATLHHERVARSTSNPDRWLVMTHGIYGAGSNWRGIARKIVERRVDWGVVLVDLRLHGRSGAGEPPHTVTACAEDLAALIRELGGVRALAGHSFGGKTSLATRDLVELEQTWVLDASPSPRAGAMTDQRNSVLRVLEMMERMPKTWPSREAFVAHVIAEGHDGGLAQWLAMNVVPEGDALINRLDPAALRSLLADYYALDLWPSVEAARGDLHFVIATRSSAVSTADRARLQTMPPHVHTHEIAGGHWLHIDAPGDVVERFVTHLP
jgi:esterase